jgi:hypothetical protein
VKTARTQAQLAEMLVWLSAAAIIICVLFWGALPLARAATIGSLFCAANFSLGRFAIARILLGGQGQRAFALLYATKFSFIVGALGILTMVMKLDVLGLIIGFSTLPLAMYLLLLVSLLKRTNKSE